MVAAERQSDRMKYLHELDDLRAPATKNGLEQHVATNIEYYCKPKNEALLPKKYCQWMERVGQFLKTDYTAEQLANLAKESRALADAEGWGTYLAALRYSLSLPRRVDPQTKLPIIYPAEVETQIELNRIIVESGGSARLTIRSMEKVAASMTGPSASRENTVGPDADAVGWGIGYVIIWPFLLALALALRITKVTADVSGWAHPG